MRQLLAFGLRVCCFCLVWFCRFASIAATSQKHRPGGSSESQLRGDAVTAASPVRKESFRPGESSHTKSNYAKEESGDISSSLTPVIGVLAQPYTHDKTNQSSYIASSYIKWLEGAGARTVVIPYQATPDLLDTLLKQIHMVFLPGGNSEYPEETLEYLLDQVSAHAYFPIWGTCLGFEFLVQYVAGTGDVLQEGFVANNDSWALEEVVPYDLYQHPRIYKTVTTTNTTFNNHHIGIRPNFFMQDPNLSSLFFITSINHDETGQAFVSTIEPRFPNDQPFYGVQYHPEKNAYEYATYPDMPTVPYQDIDHSPTGIRFSQDVAEFVVTLARKSQLANPDHVYTRPDIFPPVYTYPIKSGTQFEQVYVIPNANNNFIKRSSRSTSTSSSTV